MNTSTIPAAAAPAAAPDAAPKQTTLEWVREKLTSKTGRRVIFALQFLLSFVTVFYLAGVVRFAYRSLFYRFEIPEAERSSFCLSACLTCLEFGMLLLFTRRQIITRIVIVLAMPFYFPIFLFNYRNLVLIIPLAVLIVVTYLASGAGEGPKTILGALFLTYYILGAFLYFVVQGVLAPAVTETVIARDVSPNGSYRYSIVQQIDQADGNTYVYIEPNTKDIISKHAIWYAKGLGRNVYHVRPLDTFQYEWSTQTREEITASLLRINPDVKFKLNAEQMQILGFDKDFKQEYEAGALSRSQRKALGIAIAKDLIGGQTAEEQGVLLVESDYVVSLTFAKMQQLDLSPTLEKPLAALSDDQLAQLGVPEVNEILTVNGKVAFRQYLAVMENWFTDFDLTTFLESGTPPEVVPEGIDIEAFKKQLEEQYPKETTVSTTATTAAETTETTAETT